VVIYDLKNLSAYDFELLVKDLFEAELRLSLENFTSGRDSGIDIRYSRNKKNKIIIQCKHYVGSRLSDLYSAVTAEVNKVVKLAPERYILVTSLGLTPEAKERITTSLSPFVISSQDIIGFEGLNSLIAKHRQVELKHYKLWMTSSEVLKYILHGAIYNRSRVDQNAMLRKSQVYVQSKSYGVALKILGKNHYCIISGAPGIGKTTLAEVLALKYQTRGYSLISVSTKIEDAYSVLDEDSKQLFFFDDFLGSTFLEDRLEDSSIIRFIEFIARSRNKRFILTTREYILKQAIEESEGYARAQLKKCVVKQEDYSKTTKAHILYNHLYFSGLGEAYTRAIVESRSYMKIIGHKTFSPRIVEWMTNELNVRNIPADKYVERFVDALDNPTVIWKIAFERHLSPTARSIVLLLGLVPDSVEISDLGLLLRTWKNQSGIDLVEWNLSFKSALRELDGTFIRIEGKEANVIRFHNPSILDFVTSFLQVNPEILESYICIEQKYWDQFARVEKQFRDSKDPKAKNVILQFANLLVRNVYLPTLELEASYMAVSSKKSKPTFTRLNYILELIEAFPEDSLPVRQDVLRLAIQEAKSPFVPNHDVYFVFSKLVKEFDYKCLLETRSILEDRIKVSQSYVELAELSDIVERISLDSSPAEILAFERFSVLEDQYELEESLYDLRKTEEAIAGIVERNDISECAILDEVRMRISELEERESESEPEDGEYSDFLSEQRQKEKRESSEIERMFDTL